MAGPSGAGSVAHFLKTTRSPRASAQREIRAAIRREAAKHGRNIGEFVGFECYELCMDCGYMVEPTQADPMRSDPFVDRSKRCPACGVQGLADLRHTATADSLCELEGVDKSRSTNQRFGRALGLVAGVTTLVGITVLMAVGDGSPTEAALAMAPMTLISLPMLVSLGTGGGSQQRSMPRRWRLPMLGKGLHARPRKRTRGRAEARVDGEEWGDLLRAPLSGRPCLAYEVGVRDGADRRRASLDSWRLLEQDNVAFEVGGVSIARGQALLRLPRQLANKGMMMTSDTKTRQFMRMRGLPEAEVLHVYETVLLPGQSVAVGQVDGGPTHVFAC